MWQGRTAGNWHGDWFGSLDTGDTGWTEATSGGITLSGLASISHMYAEPVTGGLVLSGDAPIAHTYVELVDGGIVLGGEAVSQWIPAAGGGPSRRPWYRLGLGV